MRYDQFSSVGSDWVSTKKHPTSRNARLPCSARPALEISRAEAFLGLVLCLALASAAAAQEGAGRQYYETTPMPEARDKVGAAVVGDFLYVIGGHTPEGYSNSVIYAAISSDGTLGPWAGATPLPEPRLYLGNCTVVVGNWIYVAGGNIHDAQRNISAPDVLYARVATDGTIAEWRRSPAFPGPPVQCNVALVANGTLYVIGGANDANEPQPVVYRAPIQANGEVGSWSVDRPLPTPLWFHCGAAANGRIYVWGGTPSRKGGSRQDKCYSAVLQPDGSLSPWGSEPPLPVPLSMSQASTCGPFLLNFAGLQPNGEQSATIYFALTTPNGLAGQWTQVLTDLPISCYAAAAHDPRRDVIFLPGGMAPNPRDKTQLLGREPKVFGFRVLGKSNGSTAAAAARASESRPPAAPSGPAPVVEWTSVQQGFQTARATGKPLLVVLGSKASTVCAEFWSGVIQNPGFAPVAAKHVCAVVDVDADPGTAMQLGVFRVPAVAVLGPTGRLAAPPMMSNITLQHMQSLP